jgi:hypothetical protein
MVVVVGGCRIRGRHARSLVRRHWRADLAWGVEAMAGRADLVGDCLVVASQRLAAVAVKPCQIWRWPLGPNAHDVEQVWWLVLVIVLNGFGGERLSWWVVFVVAGSSLFRAQVASWRQKGVSLGHRQTDLTAPST